MVFSVFNKEKAPLYDAYVEKGSDMKYLISKHFCFYEKTVLVYCSLVTIYQPKSISQLLSALSRSF